MYNKKTRCSECEYANNKVTKYPCSKCNEIMARAQFKTNHFKNKSKIIMSKSTNVQSDLA